MLLAIKIICVFVMSISLVGMVNCIATNRQIELSEVLVTSTATTIYVTLQWLI